MTNAPLLVADCVGKRFGDRRVLSAATLRAVPGEVRVILGRSGEGKSTLMRIAAGWTAADTGVVRFSASAFLRPWPDALARLGVYYIPDDRSLSSAASLRTQLEWLRVRYGGADVEASARTMGVATCLDARPHSLSGGEQRRAELAAALVRRPRVLLADEPLRGIAPIDAERILAALRQLASEGCAVVVTGHDVEMLLEGADHVTWSTSGTTYELGPPVAARAHDRFRREYLGIA